MRAGATRGSMRGAGGTASPGGRAEGVGAARGGRGREKKHPAFPATPPEDSGVRIAAIDIGTNSIHMVIAESLSGPAFAVLDREREVVQIGRGSFKTGRVQRAAIARTVEALRRFVQLARRRQVDRLLCTTPAPVRDARHRGDV